MQILINGYAEVRLERMAAENPRLVSERQTKCGRDSLAAKQVRIRDRGRVYRAREIDVVALDVTPGLTGQA